MNKIDLPAAPTAQVEKLIEELCPDGVEFRALGEVCEVLNGYAFKSKNYCHNGIRIIRISDVQKGKMSDKDLKFYPLASENEIKRYILKENDLVMSLTGNVGRVAMLSKNDLPAGLNQRVACIRVKTSALTRYLFHFFDQISFETEAMSNATGGGQKNMSTTWLKKFKIPIPPLTIQKEIVKILDNFTQLEAELEAELEARKKQYEHYREELLSFGDDVEFRALGEVCRNVSSGGTPKTTKKEYWENGTIPWMSSGEVNYGVIHSTDKKITQLGYDSSSAKMVPPNTVVMALAGQGKTRGMVAITKIELCTNQSLCSIVVSDELNAKYLYFYLKGRYADLRRISSGDGTRGGLNLSMIKNYQIPIPPLSKQKEIVAILDKFDALVNDISTGLPAEIAARKKQYEYYRNQLLEFKVKS